MLKLKRLWSPQTWNDENIQLIDLIIQKSLQWCWASTFNCLLRNFSWLAEPKTISSIIIWHTNQSGLLLSMTDIRGEAARQSKISWMLYYRPTLADSKQEHTCTSAFSLSESHNKDYFWGRFWPRHRILLRNNKNGALSRYLALIHNILLNVNIIADHTRMKC